ncbi:MAG: hypothetical protein QOJ29_859, partial [Thermoleophilaceae bacterium]|nr:hypothetical protein [Thermoleophilaceae bacterium]
MAWKPALVLSTSIAAALATAVTAFGASPSPVVDPTVAASHEAEPIILTGANLPFWSKPANQTAKLPLTDLTDCNGSVDPSRGSSPNDWLVASPNCAHNNYAKPEVDTGDSLGDGIPTNQMLG